MNGYVWKITVGNTYVGVAKYEPSKITAAVCWGRSAKCHAGI